MPPDKLLELNRNAQYINLRCVSEWLAVRTRRPGSPYEPHGDSITSTIPSNPTIAIQIFRKRATMSKCKGYAATKAKAPLGAWEFERREPREHDVVIDIKYCGICHSDIHQTRDEWSEYQEDAIFPMVPGHEIAGIVSAVGNKVSRYKAGDKVGVGCFVGSCRNCLECRQALEQYCTVGTIWTYNAHDKVGNPTYGGYSERIVVDENYVPRRRICRWMHAHHCSVQVLRCIRLYDTGEPAPERRWPSLAWVDRATWE